MWRCLSWEPTNSPQDLWGSAFPVPMISTQMGLPINLYIIADSSIWMSQHCCLQLPQHSPWAHPVSKPPHGTSLPSQQRPGWSWWREPGRTVLESSPSPWCAAEMLPSAPGHRSPGTSQLDRHKQVLSSVWNRCFFHSDLTSTACIPAI